MKITWHWKRNHNTESFEAFKGIAILSSKKEKGFNIFNVKPKMDIKDFRFHLRTF